VSKQASRISMFGPRHKSRVPAGGQPRVGNFPIAKHGHVKLVFGQTGSDLLYRQVLGIGVACSGVRRRKDGDEASLEASHPCLQLSLNIFHPSYGGGDKLKVGDRGIAWRLAPTVPKSLFVLPNALQNRTHDKHLMIGPQTPNSEEYHA